MQKPSVYCDKNRKSGGKWLCEFKDAEGKTRRKVFHSATDARAFARNLYSFKNTETDYPMSTKERAAWNRIKESFHSLGWSQSEAVAAIDAIFGAAGRGRWTSSELVEVLGKKLAARRGRSDLTIVEAVKAFLENLGTRGLRPKTIQQQESVLHMMVRHFGNVALSEVTPAMLVEWVTERYESEVSRATVRTRLRSWAKWCSEEGREWLPASYHLRIVWKSVRTDARPIEFLTADEVSRLLLNCAAGIRCGLALVAFAGVRPMEAARLLWENVSWSTRSIMIPGAAAKTRTGRRLHDLPANIWKWLETVPARERTGKIIPLNPRNASKHLIKAREAAGITRWPHDALRHSFGTHGWHRGAEWVAATMGHVRGFDMLAKHYRGCVSVDEAKRYFEISPTADLVTSPAAEAKGRWGGRRKTKFNS